MKKIFNLGNICLFLAALLVTVATAVIVNVCGGEKLSVVMASAFAGIIGTLAFGGIAEARKWEITDGPEPGIIGTLAGMVIAFFFI